MHWKFSPLALLIILSSGLSAQPSGFHLSSSGYCSPLISSTTIPGTDVSNGRSIYQLPALKKFPQLQQPLICELGCDKNTKTTTNLSANDSRIRSYFDKVANQNISYNLSGTRMGAFISPMISQLFTAKFC